MTLLMLAFLHLGVPDSPPTSADSEAVVAIYAEVTPDSVVGGTGFFISSSGDILTCYHVIEGARRLTVYYAGHDYPVIVKAVSPQVDLARLSLLPPVPRHPYLALAVRPSSNLWSEELHVVGWPRGAEKSVLYGRVSSSGLTNSLSLRTQTGERVFVHSIDLLKLDISAYGGMSGGPVISSEGVVGILSGSYAEGGGIAWAIPSQYADYGGALQIEREPADIKEWPKFDLVVEDRRFNGLRGLYRRNETAAAQFRRVETRFAVAESVTVATLVTLRAVVKPTLDSIARYDSLLMLAITSAELRPGGEKSLQRFLSVNYYEMPRRAAPALKDTINRMRRAYADAQAVSEDEELLWQRAARLQRDSNRTKRFDSTYRYVEQNLRVTDSAIDYHGTSISQMNAMLEQLGKIYDKVWLSVYSDVDEKRAMDLGKVRRLAQLSRDYFGSLGGLYDVAFSPIYVEMVRHRFQLLSMLREAIVYEARPTYRGGYD